MSISDWFGLLLGWCLPFTAYLFATIFALVALPSPWRWVALVPLPVMAWIVYATDQAFAAHSSQAPLLLILAGPPAFIFVLLLCVAVHISQRARSNQPLQPTAGETEDRF
jgi:hypothetical protein